MEIKKSPKISKKYDCQKCDFRCSKLSEWNIHVARPKHQKNVSGNNWKYLEIKNLQKTPFLCECGKKYNTSSGLWKHKKMCIYKDETPQKVDASNNVIIELLKQNQEFKELIVEQNKQLLEQNKQIIELASKPISSGNIINSNNTNNKFNLNFFLNEQCKDALNIMDFVNSLALQLNDLENVGKLGYSEGISKIFINGLKQLDVFKRPIHCSDLKRETLYVKDENAWEKENDEKAKIKQAIKRIANKNIKQIPEWQKENTQSQDTTTKKHEEYMKIVGESMGGVNYIEDERNYNRIIKNVAKEVVIDK